MRAHHYLHERTVTKTASSRTIYITDERDLKERVSQEPFSAFQLFYTFLNFLPQFCFDLFSKKKSGFKGNEKAMFGFSR